MVVGLGDYFRHDQGKSLSEKVRVTLPVLF